MKFILILLILVQTVDGLANTDSDATTGVKIADGTNVDGIILNYTKYEQLLMNYTNDTLSTSDSVDLVTLANKCPYVDGAVIYQARSLYSRIFEDYRVFGNTGCDSTMAAGKAPHAIDTIAAQQSFKLYPNPNDGKITLLQAILENEMAQVEIFNSLGIVVYNNTLSFRNGKTTLNVGNAPPGLYLLQLYDEKGIRYAFKFTLN